jgi:thiopeptide-type bacteriocin biosynthesis protein
MINKWFFIRYVDPKFHLRIRFHLSEKGSFDVIMRLLHHKLYPYSDNGLIANVMFDSYNREIERYGVDTIIPSESLFYADSQAIANIVSVLRETGDSDHTRWLIALRLVDDMLTAANYNADDKVAFIQRVDNTFRNEFGITSSTYTKPLNAKYRVFRKEIYDTITKNQIIITPYEDILLERLHSLQHIFSTITDCNDKTIDELMSSYTHMTINRLFRSNNRLCEMVIYYLMHKHYASYIAMEKYGK